jgi:hypothetical protein
VATVPLLQLGAQLLRVGVSRAGSLTSAGRGSARLLLCGDADSSDLDDPEVFAAAQPGDVVAALFSNPSGGSLRPCEQQATICGSPVAHRGGPVMSSANITQGRGGTTWLNHRGGLPVTRG